MMNHYRALFPRWNFFDRIAYNFELHYRSSEENVWQKFLFTQSRTFLSLFYSPNCNLALAQISIIEHFVRDTKDNSQKELAFKMLVALVKTKFQANEKFQFKIVACKANEKIDYFVSEFLSGDYE